jgi:hypothetical protein
VTTTRHQYAATQWVAECFWPGVRDEDVSELGARVLSTASDVAHGGGQVDYLGSLRITDDDVVLFLFEGSIGSVRQVTERAGIRAHRILHCTRTSVRSDVDPSSTRSRP